MRNVFCWVMLLWAGQVLAGNPVPRDQNNNLIYSGNGRPVFSEAVTLTTSTYVQLLTLPATGENHYRHWKGIAVRNPSAVRTVYICFGDSTGCTTDAMKIPVSLGLALDQIYFGPLNTVTTIWGRLDASGTSTPELTVW